MTGARARTRRVKRSYGAAGRAHEAVIHIVRVIVVPCDSSRRVDAICEGALPGACACARCIERHDVATGAAHETMKNIARVYEKTRDRLRCVHTQDVSALTDAGAGAGDLEGGEGGLGLRERLRGGTYAETENRRAYKPRHFRSSWSQPVRGILRSYHYSSHGEHFPPSVQYVLLAQSQPTEAAGVTRANSRRCR